MSVTTVGPAKIFGLVAERNAGDRVMKVKMPLRLQGDLSDGSLRLLDTFILLALQRIVQAERVFEMGTFMGSTTFNLALNGRGAIHTFDLPVTAEDTSFHGSLRRARKLDFEGTEAEGRVNALTGDSRTYDFSGFAGMMDLVFLDGDREYPQAESDTEWAFRMLRKDKPAAIAWHDYGEISAAPDHMAYLDRLSERLPLFHPRDTLLCLYFSDPEMQKAMGD